MIYIAEKFFEVTAQMNSLLSEQRVNKIVKLRSERDRINCALVYLLLRKALFDEFGIDEAVEFGFGNFRKPYLIGYPEIFFSLSHSYDVAACVVAGEEVGVDVQKITRVSDKAAKRVLTVNEYAEFSLHSDPDDYFCRVWTMKESYIKMTGKGLATELDKLASNNIEKIRVIKRDGYYCSVCGPQSEIKYIGRDEIEQLCKR